MGAIQQAVNTTIGVVGAIKKLQQYDNLRMEQANERSRQQKVLRLKQRAVSERYRANIEKAKYEKLKYKQQTAELKNGTQKGTAITIAGQKIDDPNLLKKIKEGLENGK